MQCVSSLNQCWLQVLYSQWLLPLSMKRYFQLLIKELFPHGPMLYSGWDDVLSILDHHYISTYVLSFSRYDCKQLSIYRSPFNQVDIYKSIVILTHLIWVNRTRDSYVLSWTRYSPFKIWQLSSVTNNSTFGANNTYSDEGICHLPLLSKHNVPGGYMSTHTHQLWVTHTNLLIIGFR